MKNTLLLFTLISITLLLLSTTNHKPKTTNNEIRAAVPDRQNANKINGLSFVSPPRPFGIEKFEAIQQINANWIAICPFGFTRPNSNQVIYNQKFQWWGERPEGIVTIIQYAKEKGIQVLLKPQVWSHGFWVGDFEPKTEQGWKEWERSYTDYIMPLVTLADTMEVPLFCIGTEYKIAAQKRPIFWRNLIEQIRCQYQGKLTYAANWDNIENIPFWEALDYIGVDAYFPLVADSEPSVTVLKKAWEQPFRQMKNLHDQYHKQILFTEFGYLCIDQSAWRAWENEAKLGQLKPNEKAQQNAYEALFQTFWDTDWCAGGFLWKWYIDTKHMDEPEQTGYDPKGKAVATTIQNWYGK